MQTSGIPAAPVAQVELDPEGKESCKIMWEHSDHVSSVSVANAVPRRKATLDWAPGGRLGGGAAVSPPPVARARGCRVWT